MNKKKGAKTFLKQYSPEQANSIDLFSYYGISEFSFDEKGSSLFYSLLLRLDKINLLWLHLQELCDIANKKETQELKEKGYVDPKKSKLASAIFEAILNEYYNLYSNLALVIGRIYSINGQEMPQRFSILKKNILKNKYSNMPKEIINIFKSNEIYDELRIIRTQSAHFSTGSLNTDSKPYSYMNQQSMGRKGRIPRNITFISDIGKFYQKLELKTKEFLNAFFYQIMKDIEGKKQIEFICGIYKGRIFMLYESYSEFKSGKRGICKPTWKNQDSSEFQCPFARECKLYQNYLDKVN